MNRDTEQNEKATKNSDNDDVEIENNNNGVSIGDDMRLLEEKAGMCIDIFNSVRFHQAVIFVSLVETGGEKLSAIMTKKGGFKTAFISGKLTQRERMDVMQRFHDFGLGMPSYRPI